MRYKALDNGGNLFAIIEHQKAVSAKVKGVNKLNKVIDWEMFRELLEKLLGYHNRKSKHRGRPPFDPVFMFKVLLLQKFYGLSDEATQEQIADRFSFMEFLGLRPGDAIPDANTIWDFRENLDRDQRNGSGQLFERFEKLLSEKGMIGHEGSIVDASFVEAPRQRNSREQNEQIAQGQTPEGFEKDTAKGKQKDCDARWAVKNNQNYYGYKNHIKIDAKSKLVTKYQTTAANVHDSQTFTKLVDSTDQAVFADSAYASEAHETYLLEQCDCQTFIHYKATKDHPLSPEDKLSNKMRSRIRVRIEHVFARLTHMGLDRIRSIGLHRANQHNALANLVYNMDRYALLSL